MEDQLLSHPVLQGELDNPKNGDSAHKHLKQQVPHTVISVDQAFDESYDYFNVS